MGELTVRVARVLDEAVDVRSFELRGADGGALPPYTPGSHVDVHAAPGIVRQYSLCGDPRETDRYLIAVKREAASRGGSVAMHERVSEGASLVIGTPRNNFALVPGASHHLLIAGGIGITPILAMARHLLAALRQPVRWQAASWTRPNGSSVARTSCACHGARCRIAARRSWQALWARC